MDTRDETALVFDCGDSQLLGILHGPESAASGVVFVAGGGQYRVGSHRLYVQLARDLAANGISVLRFDHRGVGDSTGSFRGFEYLDEDIRAAVEVFRKKRPGLRTISVLGLCDGAAAALMAAPVVHAVDGLILINPWVHSSDLEARTRFASYYLDRLKSREFWAKAIRGHLDLDASSRSFGRYLRDAFRSRRDGDAAHMAPRYVVRMLESLRRFRGRVLVVLSGQDLVAQQFQLLVTRDRRWKDALDRDEIRIAKFQSADHTFSYVEHRRAVEERIRDWLLDEHADNARAHS